MKWPSNFYPAICTAFRINWCPTLFTMSLRELLVPEQVKFIPISRSYYADARNYMVHEALKAGCSHIFFLDEDMVFNSDVLYKLQAQNRDIIGAFYCERRSPYLPCVFRFDQEGYLCKLKHCEYNGEIDVDVVGDGAILIKAEVFDTLEEPWFRWNEKDLVPKNTDKFITGDVGFCLRSKAVGYKVYCHTDIIMKHMGEEKLIDQTFQE